MKLTRNMRVEALGLQSSEGAAMHAFSQWLLDIGEGKQGTKLVLENDMVVDYEDDQRFVGDIFPNLRSGEATLDSCILMPLNKEVNAMNGRILEKFAGVPTSFPCGHLSNFMTLIFKDGKGSWTGQST